MKLGHLRRWEWGKCQPGDTGSGILPGGEIYGCLINQHLTEHCLKKSHSVSPLTVASDKEHYVKCLFGTGVINIEVMGVSLKGSGPWGRVLS